VNPFAAANALAIRHQDIADKVARNISRKTGHSAEDLRQIAMMGIIQASRRYKSERGDFRPYARSYANGEVLHFLRDKGFLVKVSPQWRELYARGMKLLRSGCSLADTKKKLGISDRLWDEIENACTQKVVRLPNDEA
jgi:RNA polymerase sigma factor (sigma-70 family)